MNRTLYEYCYGSTLRRWHRPKSADALVIHELIRKALNLGEPDDSELLDRLGEISTVSSEGFRLLKPLHGCGGSEGCVLDVDSAVEAEFWIRLATRFPNNQGVCYVASDAALLADDEATALRLFMQAFRIDPETPSPFAVGWEDLLQSSEWHLEYRLHLLAQLRRDDPDEVAKETNELRSLFGDDPKQLQMIELVAGGSAVPTIEGTI